MFKKLGKFFCSLRLTVVCLGFAVALVFLGTIAQVDEGLYQAQGHWFRSFIVWWRPHGAGWRFPIFPGGYLIGGVLLINLIAAHIQRFQFTWKKLGIHLAHAGIILLLVGQLATDLLSQENGISFRKGETRRYAESLKKVELVCLTDAAAPGQDEVVSIPELMLKDGNDIRHEKLPFSIRVKNYYVNADAQPRTNAEPASATHGFGASYIVLPEPEVRNPEGTNNMPAAIVELVGTNGSLGTWWVAAFMHTPQEVQVGGKTWRIELRWLRSYLPYSIKLLGTKYELYPGTETPKNFQSRVRIEDPAKGENREVDIYMNNPLRYEGQTFYQYQMGQQDVEEDRGSTLEVVKNPSWLTPYLGCLMVGGGLAYQFLAHLAGFISKRRTA